MILPFGKFKGLRLCEVPDSYLIWITNKDQYDQIYGDPWEKSRFKIDMELDREARAELNKRGFKRHGLRWVRE